MTGALVQMFVDEALSNSLGNHIANIGKVGRNLSTI